MRTGAVSSRVANALGAGNPSAAKLSVYVAAALTVTATGACCMTALLLRRELALAFSSDSGIKALFVSVMPILAANLIGDGVNATCSGVVRGAGRQSLGAASNLVSFWVLGIPLSVLLAFHLKLGVVGLLSGLLVASLTQGE